jgi:hypothetical protein
MKIQCALSQSQVEKLYSNIYGHMLDKGSEFDPQQYMKDLFNKIANKSDVETAAKFMQQVPSLIGTASFRPALEEFDIKTDNLRPLIRAFKNTDQGLENTIKHFIPMLNPEVKKELVEQNEKAAFTIEERTGDLAIKDADFYLPYSAMSTTFQEFVTMDPSAADVEEMLEPSKKVIYNTIRKIGKEFTSKAALKAGVYQGVEIKLKPVRLTEVDPTKLDKATARLLNRALYLQEQGKSKANVTKPENIFLMVMSDKQGNDLYFSQDGDITTIENGGALVYQFYRDVRKEGDRYVVRDIYNQADQILSPEIMVNNLIERGTLVGLSPERIAEITKAFAEKQQAEFKDLYDFRVKLESGEQPLIPITGVSKGIAEAAPSSLSLANLNQVVSDFEEAMATIDTVKSPRSGFGKGDAVIQLDGTEYKIDRPNLTADLARKIAAVLTNKNISKKERYKFVMQFLAPKASSSTRKHTLNYLPNTDELLFSYSKNTYKEGYDSKFTPVDLESATAAEDIYNALMQASGTEGKYFPAKMTYNKELLKINGYQDYNLQTNELDSDYSTYTNLLASLPNTKIFVDVQVKSRSFNSYIGFSLPNEFTEQQDRVEEETETIIEDDFFDTLVEPLSEGEALYTSIREEALAPEWTAQIDAKTKSKNKDVYYISTYLTDQFKNNPSRFTKELALEMVANFEIVDKGSQQQITILNKAIETAFKPKVVKQKSVEEIENEINQVIAPDNIPSPEDGEAGDVFFFRSENLPSDVSPEQIADAKKWWGNSKLNKYIDLKQVANIVNSNAYAAFIKHGSVLNGNLGTIQIANKGSMVDVYHEAWHGFSQLFLTKADKKALYKEVRKKLGGRKSFFEIEERLAEDFRTYAMNPKAEKDSPKRNTIFRKILNFLRELFGLGSVTDVMEIGTVREMFDKLYLGKDLNNYTPLIDNVMFDVLERNSGVVMPGTTEDQVLNRQDSNTLKNAMDSIISDIVNEANKSVKDSSRTLSVLLDSRNRDGLYKRIRQYLDGMLKRYETQLAETPETDENQIKRELLQNRIRIISTGLNAYGNAKEGLVKYHLDNSAYDLIKQKYTVLELDEEGNLFDPSSATETERYGDKKVGDKSLIELAGKETLYILKSVHAKNKKGEFEYDELGFKKLADFRTLWNNTVRAISGIQDPQQMYTKLLEESKNVPEFEQLVSLTAGEGKLANPSLSNNLYEFRTTTSFWQDFNKPRVPYIQLTVFGKQAYSKSLDKEGNPIPITLADDSPLLEFSVDVTDASVQTYDVIRKFQDRFKANLRNKYVDRVGRDNIPTLNLQEVTKDFADKDGNLNIDKSYEFAKAIGIDLDNLPVVKGALTKDNKTIEKFGLPYIYSIIKKLAAKELDTVTKPAVLAEVTKFKQDPINALMTGIKAGVLGNSSINQKQQIKELANLQARYGSDVSNFAVLNAERNLVFEHIDNNSITKQVYALNNAKKLSDLWTTDEFQYMSHMDPTINAYTTRLRTINSLFDLKSSTQLRRKNTNLNLFMDSGTQKAIEGQEEGTNTTGLDVNSKFLQELHTMLKDGAQEFMRHASKSSSFGAKVEGGVVGLPGKEGNDNHLWIDIDMFKNNTAYEYALKAHLLPYMEAEAERIYRFRQNKEEFKKYAGYNRPLADGRMAGEVFTAFDDVLSKDIKEKIYTAIDKAIAEKKNFDLRAFINNSGLQGNVRQNVREYFKKQTDATLALLQESKYISPDLYERFADTKLSQAEQERILIDAYVHNAWVHNFEMGILFYGDFAQFNHDKEEMHKRNTGSTSGGPGYRTDVNAQRFVNDYLAKTSYAKSIGAKTISYDGTFNTAILQDVVRESEYLDQIEKGLRADYEKRYKGTGVSQAEIDRRIGIELDKYKKMEEGDGQGFISFDGYRTLANLQNNWSNAQEILFQRIVNKEVVSAKEITEMFPVLKAQNFGSLVSKVGEQQVTGLPVTAMHKFALAPLIPSVIEGSDLQSLHDQMMKEGVQYVTFQTGSKVGSITSDGKADKIYDDNDQRSLKKDIKFTPNRIYLEYLKNVTNVPNKYKAKTVFSTQLRKIILNGMYRNGKIINPENAAAVKEYEDTVDAYSDVLKFELLNEIGYTYNEKTDTYSGNLHDFLDVVQRELDRRDIPEHLVQLVGLNRDNSLKTDLSLHLKADEIEKILVSLVEKRLVKQKVKGEALVQVSSAMSNGIWDGGVKFKAATKKEIQKYRGSNNLPFYRTETVDFNEKYKGKSISELKAIFESMQRVETNKFTPTNRYIFSTEFNYLKDVIAGKKPAVATFEKPTSAMKVAIAMQGDFVNLLKREDVAVYDEQDVDGEIKKVLNVKASTNKLNQLIKDEEWLEKNRNLVTLSAVRIPVQGLNSMEFMEVYEFLDPSAGNIIIPPSEIVAKSGADFDVDKLTTFMPSISEKGRFIETGMTNEALKNKVEELNQTEEGRKVAERMIKTQKAALENRLITSIKGILELPDNYASLVKPNDTYLLKDDIADKIQDDVIEYNRFENVHDKIKLGKKGQKVISPTRILEVPYNLHKHDVNMIGKKVLGMIAVENSLHPVFNSVGAYLPKTYKASVWNQEQQKYEDIDEDYDVRLFLPHNKTDNNEVSLSGTDTADGLDNIAELYSQMMNGAVDVEKDAWIFFIQGNFEVTPMITFLLKAGVPKEHAVLFASNPFVREYAKQQRLIKSAYAKLTGTIPQDFKSSMGKYKAADLAMKKFGIREKASKLVSNNSYYDAVSNNVINKKLLDKEGNFDLAKMKEILKDPKLQDENLRDYAFGMFLHFIELEKMSKGFTTLKMQSNPDTKTSKTLQEILRRNLSLEDAKEISKLPEGMVDAMQESILGSFFDNKLISDLVIPVFPLRNSQEVTDFIINKTKTQSSQITKKFGAGQDGVRQFITKFKNAIPNYIYQNYMSNMLDETGKITSMPKVYDKLNVKERSGIARGAEVEGDTIYVDRAQLEKEFANNLYARDNNTEEGYKRKGLVGFNISDNLFPNESQYFKYVMERERQRSILPLAEQAENKDYKKFLSLTEKYEKDPVKAKEIAYERFLNQRALINAFNRKAIMDLSNGTYTDMVLDMVDEFKHLKVKYPILAQLSKPNLKSGQSVLTLNDLKDLKDPQLSEIYYQNIKDLADETVHKVSDPQDNARISKLFRLFPVMMIYQHGLGYSKYGFNDVLPYEDYIGVMQTASDIFMNNEMSNATLETVYDRLVNSRGLFPDYVTAPGLYRSGSPRQADEIITTDVNDERVQEMLSRVMGSEEAPTPSASVSILPTDKIIWGHPTIGKTTAKQQNDFFDFDTDFKPLVAQKLGLPKSEQNSIGLNKWRKTGNEEEFNQAMREVWTLAKAQAKQQNKMLMVSDMLFLRENASDFDKVINIPTETFIERATERGDNKESLQNWKTKIDKVLESIDQNKIITTDKYLSELLPTEAPEMKRDTPIQPEVSDMIQPEGLPAIPRTSSSCK